MTKTELQVCTHTVLGQATESIEGLNLNIIYHFCSRFKMEKMLNVCYPTPNNSNPYYINILNHDIKHHDYHETNLHYTDN